MKQDSGYLYNQGAVAGAVAVADAGVTQVPGSKTQFYHNCSPLTRNVTEITR